MIEKLRNTMLVLAAVAGFSVCSVMAGGWSNQITSGSFSAQVTAPTAATVMQMGYTYGGYGQPPNQYGCLVINNGPLGNIYLTKGDVEDKRDGVVAAGTYSIYQYVYTSLNPITGGVLVTVVQW